MTFSTEVREELAHTQPGRRCCRLAEAGGLMRVAGTLTLRGGQRDVAHELTTAVGGVARRLHATAGELFGLRPELEVHQPSGLRRTVAYRVRTIDPDGRALAALGLMDEHGHPRRDFPVELVRRRCDEASFVRGAFMAAGSVSGPGQPPHLEIPVSSEATAAGLTRLVHRCGGQGSRMGARVDTWRVYLKSGSAIGAVLARIGAHAAFLAWDEERLRRELRSEANRAANADRANLRRAVGASAEQVRRIEQALRSAEWAEIPEELRAVALARLANPEANLSELGQLLDPPVGKTTVHRRLGRFLERIGDEVAGTG